MTKLYAKVFQLKVGAIHAAGVAQRAGQTEAYRIWDARTEAYDDVLNLLEDPEIIPTRWKRIVCKIFHQRHSLKCQSCGGTF